MDSLQKITAGITGKEAADIINGNDTTLWNELNIGVYKYPYNSAATGVDIAVLKNVIKDVYLHPDKVNPANSYYIASILRNKIPDGGTSPVSQVTIYARNSSGTLSPFQRFEIAGDAANGEINIYKGTSADFAIYWDAMPDNSGYTQMLTGYELDPLCFDADLNRLSNLTRVEYLEDKANRPIYKYPYKQNQEGTNITQLIQAIKEVYINPNVIESGKTYTVSSVRRNHDAGSGAQSQVAIYSRRDSDGAIALIEQFVFSGDVADGNTQILRGTKTAVAINWDLLPNPYAATNMVTNMAGNYELDENCFSENNILNIANEFPTYSPLFYDKPTLTTGYVDTRSGGVSGSSAFGSTGYIPVYPGQIIRYVGGMYGNAGICGYPTRAVTGYVVIHDSNTETENRDFEFTVPEGVNYIRACVYYSYRAYLELFYTKSYNYALFANVGISDNIEILNLIFKGAQVETTTYVSDTEKQSVRWLELKDNFDMPSKGVYIGRQGDDVVLSINGVITKLNQ